MMLKFTPTYRMEPTHAVIIAINCLSVWNQYFPVLEQRRKKYCDFDGDSW